MGEHHFVSKLHYENDDGQIRGLVLVCKWCDLLLSAFHELGEPECWGQNVTWPIVEFPSTTAMHLEEYLILKNHE